MINYPFRNYMFHSDFIFFVQLKSISGLPPDAALIGYSNIFILRTVTSSAALALSMPVILGAAVAGHNIKAVCKNISDIALLYYSRTIQARIGAKINQIICKTGAALTCFFVPCRILLCVISFTNAL
jgi:hypothetical protein